MHHRDMSSVAKSLEDEFLIEVIEQGSISQA